MMDDNNDIDYDSGFLGDESKDQRDQEEDDLRECTFQPKINSISRAIANYVRPYPIEDSILYYEELKQKKLEALKLKYPKNIVNWTFQPQISKKSQRMMEMRNSSNCFRRLYNEAKTREVRKMKLHDDYTKEECPFMPNSKGKSSSQEKEKKKPRKAVQDFLKRYREDLRLKNLSACKHLICQRGLKNLGDTDKKLLGWPIHSDNCNSMNDGEGSHLSFNKENKKLSIKQADKFYQKGMEFHKKKVENSKVNRKDFVPKINKKDKKHNNEIFQVLMERRFTTIFKILDMDNDGLINSSSINVEGLNVDIVIVLSEMLFEIEDYELVLNEDQFKKACWNLYSQLKYPSKIILRNSKLKKRVEDSMEKGLERMGITQRSEGGRRDGNSRLQDQQLSSYNYLEGTSYNDTGDMESGLEGGDTSSRYGGIPNSTPRIKKQGPIKENHEAEFEEDYDALMNDLEDNYKIFINETVKF